MRIDCKICKTDLTSETIALFEGKIDTVNCSKCELRRNETKKLYYKQFDKFLATLKKYNDNY
jgi:transcription elongation factor Elf1